ncbi:MAG: hypothetical protein IH608_01480, partial [Proteobacteria bacterium]|nr:hypothetical protein [Pseudomonadota bacterium]
MKPVAAWVVLAWVLGAGFAGAQEARFVGEPLAGFRAPFDFAPAPGGGGVLVLEDLARRVVSA